MLQLFLFSTNGEFNILVCRWNWCHISFELWYVNFVSWWDLISKSCPRPSMISSNLVFFSFHYAVAYGLVWYWFHHKFPSTYLVHYDFPWMCYMWCWRHILVIVSALRVIVWLAYTQNWCHNLMSICCILLFYSCNVLVMAPSSQPFDIWKQSRR